jgi:hypothetical protein
VSVLCQDLFSEIQLSSHKNEVTCLENLENEKFFLASGSYDTRVKKKI